MSSKILYTQGEVAKFFGVLKESVAEWEKEGLIKLHSIHIKSKARLYHEKDVIALLKLKPESAKITKCSNFSICKTVLGLSEELSVTIIVSFNAPNNCLHVDRDNSFCYTCKSLLFRRIYCEPCAAKYEQEHGKYLIAEDPPYKCRPIDWRKVEHSFGFSSPKPIYQEIEEEY